MMDSPLHAKVGEGLHHHFRDHLQLVSSAGSINSGTIISNSSSMTTLGSSLSATTSNGIVNTNQANSLTNDVIKTGHFKIKKRKNYKERFCVLRCESSDGPARFEYYESEKKFRHNSAPKLSIILTDCFHICRKYGSLNNNDHLLCFFTKDDCITIAFDDDKKLSEWLQALNDMNNFKLKEKNAKYERVWQITISKNKNPDRENLAGVHRLCLTNNKKLHLVSVDSSENEPKIHEIALSCVRRLGHSKKYFQLELGRFASIGAGRIIMLTDEETTSRDMHEAILNKIEHTSSCNDSEPRSMRSDASRPRSLSTSEGFRPTSTRRTSREVILPSSNSIIGSTSSVISTTSTSTTPSTPITLVSLHNSLASPGPAYSTILSSIRGRCDSLPSNYRNTITNPKSTAAITVQDGSYLPMAPISKQNHGEVAKNNFVSSPITAASTTISTVQSLKESTVSTSAITVNTCSNVQKTSQTSATALTTTTTPAAAAVSTANCDKKSQEIVKDEQNEDDYFELSGPLKKIDSYRSSSSESAFSSGLSSAAGSRTRSIEEFKLEKVKSYITSQEEDDNYFDNIKPVRAYSMGSRPPFKEGGFKSLKNLRTVNATGERQLQSTSTAICDPQSRVRSLSMGSQNARVRSPNIRNK